MVVSASLRYFEGKAGGIIISAYTVYIAWKGLICGVSGLDASDQRLIGWIDLNSPVFINAGAWTSWQISSSMVEKSGL